MESLKHNTIDTIIIYALKCFGKTESYFVHLISFLYTGIEQKIEIFPHVKEIPTYITLSIPWLLIPAVIAPRVLL